MGHKNWNLLAIHVRTNHIHVVVQAEQNPESVMIHFKAYATRALNAHDGHQTRRKIWARHGSTKYLWEAEDVRSVVRYVVEEQGLPMAVWINPNPNPIMPFPPVT